MRRNATVLACTPSSASVRWSPLIRSLLLAAADGLLVEQLASDRTADVASQLRRLAAALVVA